ncbi:MAG TPA: N-acetylmuramoyl-L-alanine amidase, partial [Flavipsychrobacter sp.]|nr:N-acetylmuramoyl-L-alanine amidase [Flavipsychrobacter sp.]
MEQYIFLLLKSVACSGILFAYYLLFLKNKKLHNYNRYYLLTATILSLLVPFLEFKSYGFQTTASNPIIMLDPASGADYIEPIGVATAKEFPLEQVASWIYFTVCIAMLSLLLFRLAWIYRLKRKGRAAWRDGHAIIYTGCPQAPFSFGRTLFWRWDMDIDSPESELILKHELYHIRSQHTADKLFMQLVVTFAWANPVLWLMKKELALQHEFSADDAALHHSDTDSFARMILHAKFSSITPDIIHPFFHSSIKRRFIMLTRSKKTKFSFLRRAMLLPLSASVLLLLSFELHVAPALPDITEVNRAKETISVMFDAAHGGHDMGATGAYGMQEKDLTLNICNKLTELAPEYNIKASLTRQDDRYISLPDRVAISERSGSDLFIAIHVDKSADEGTEKHVANGFEVIVSGKNKYPGQSRLLASAIVPRLASLQVLTRLSQSSPVVIREAGKPAILIECGNIE